MSDFIFNVDGSRLFIHASNAQAGYWLGSLATDLRKAGVDFRVDHSAGQCLLILPLPVGNLADNEYPP